MSEAKTSKTYVQRFSYRKFIGTYNGWLTRYLAAFNYNLSQIKRSTAVKIAFGIYFLFILFQNLFIFSASRLLEMVSEEFGEEQLLTTEEKNQLFQEFYIDSINISNAFNFFPVLIVIGLAGGGLFADDIKFRSIDLYISRIGRRDYLFSKISSIYFVTVIVLVFPAVIQYFVFAIGAEINYLHLDNLEILFRVVLALLIDCFIYSVLILAISALSERGSYATIIFFAGITGTTIIGTMIAGLSGSDAFMAIILLLSILVLNTYIILGQEGFEEYYFGDLGMNHVVGFLISLIVICSIVIYWKIIRRYE